MLIKDWTTDTPTPLYYHHPPRLSPYPLLGFGKFVARGIQKLRSVKSYLAAHPSWVDEKPALTCLRCGTDQETFKHAILDCPARS